ncbi:MAG: hypothetical protein H0T60_09660 [Acidobacteria bacterium]|nr:hypothetical protein [Acidobacteriota bacterium]
MQPDSQVTECAVSIFSNGLPNNSLNPTALSVPLINIVRLNGVSSLAAGGG